MKGILLIWPYFIFFAHNRPSGNLIPIHTHRFDIEDKDDNDDNDDNDYNDNNNNNDDNNDNDIHFWNEDEGK